MIFNSQKTKVIDHYLEYSTVKLAVNAKSGERVAVKIINRKSYTPRSGESFEKEVEVFEKVQVIQFTIYIL